MRKFSVRFAILCILVLLIGVTALAISGRVSNLSNQDANVVEVTLNPGNSGEDPTFTIIRKNAEKGKLYTVLIRSGAENAEPSGGDNGNLVYMDMVEATQDGDLRVTKAYPKEMSEGTYRVFVSDYGKNAVAQVATFEVGGTENPTDVKLGDVNGDGKVDIKDALALLRHDAGIEGYDLSNKASVADINHDNKIDIKDALIALRHDAGILDIEEVYGS